MATINILSPFILSWEGKKYTNNPTDKGGPTKYGVTLDTWKKHGRDLDGDGVITEEDVKLITEADATRVMKEQYWDLVHADEIHSQSIANLIVDFVWGAGRKNAVTIIQEVVGVERDGIMGNITIGAINAQDPVDLFNRLHARRQVYYQNVVKAHPEQATFLKGWLRRLDSIQYSQLKCNGGDVIPFDDMPQATDSIQGSTPGATNSTQTEGTPTGDKGSANFLELIIRFLSSLFKK